MNKKDNDLEKTIGKKITKLITEITVQMDDEVKKLRVEHEGRLREIDKEMEKIKEIREDIFKMAFQIAAFMSGLFAIILSIYVGIISAEKLVINYPVVITGSILLLAIIFIIWIGMHIYYDRKHEIEQQKRAKSK
jgi:hypothetical protein